MRKTFGRELFFVYIYIRDETRNYQFVIDDGSSTLPQILYKHIICAPNKFKLKNILTIVTVALGLMQLLLIFIIRKMN